MQTVNSLGLSQAIDDLKKHSLRSLSGDLSRLIYLAATRDYNTGKYYHDGLAIRFSSSMAGQALAACHREIFEQLMELPLEQFVGQLEEYVESNSSEKEELIKMWQTLEPFRIVIPNACDPISAHLFCSNLRIALAILEHRAKNPRKNQPTASQLP